MNGKPVGSWGSAFNPVTFDITDQLDGSGENTLSVRVTTASFANEFDHHDCWGLAGIYRDVWLFTLPESHLRSWTAQTTLREDGMAEVRLPVEVSKAAHDGSTVEGTITDADGHTREIKFNAQEPGHYEGTLQVPANLLWSAEVPVLHSLHLSLTRDGKTVHEIRSKVALREVRVDGPRLLVNGRRVKLRGRQHITTPGRTPDAAPPWSGRGQAGRMRQRLLFDSAHCARGRSMDGGGSIGHFGGGATIPPFSTARSGPVLPGNAPWRARFAAAGSLAGPEAAPYESAPEPIRPSASRVDPALEVE